MSHALYTTEAFVLGSRPLGEANRSVALYTEAFGLVRATAQGVRLSKSKLKFRLYTFARVRVTLVRGREVWRLVGAEEGERPRRLLGSRARTALCARVTSLVSRFVQGEESDGGLYGELDALVRVLDAEETPALSLLEAVFVARILALLGYLPEVSGVSDRIFEPEIFMPREHDLLFEKKLIDTINITLAHVQL